MTLSVVPRFVFLACFAVSIFGLVPLSASAQLDMFGLSRLNLVMSPEFPAPGKLVRVSLNDYSVDAPGASIAWYVDAVLRPEFADKRTIELITPPLGKRASVSVVLTTPEGSSISAKTTLVPVQIDLVLEADTYVPVFYRGRALPSPESQVRAIALVHDGTGSAPASYTYTWSVDGTVLFGGPSRGKYAADITVTRFAETLLSVKITDSSGALIGSKSVAVRSTEPKILFYENSPLRGLLERAIGPTYPLISESVSVYGEPFYLHTDVTERTADFSWEIDGDPVNTSSSEANAITLEQAGKGGEASVRLRVVTKEQIPQVAEGSFSVFLNNP